MSLCDQEGCPGHLAKFPDCLTELLWEISLMDGEATGSTEAYGHHTLIHSTGETRILGETLGVQTHSPEVTIQAGWYMVTATELGHVYHTSYANEAEATEAFEALESEYSEWLDINEPEGRYFDDSD